MFFFLMRAITNIFIAIYYEYDALIIVFQASLPKIFVAQEITSCIIFMSHLTPLIGHSPRLEFILV
jgi:hypothetical protein